MTTNYPKVTPAWRARRRRRQCLTSGVGPYTYNASPNWSKTCMRKGGPPAYPRTTFRDRRLDIDDRQVMYTVWQSATK